MNWEIVQGKWLQLKGELKSRWSKLTDDDLALLDGKRERLVGVIVERYGVLKEEAEREIDEWTDKIAAKLRDVGHRGAH